jgi:hypothetical protein
VTGCSNETTPLAERAGVVSERVTGRRDAENVGENLSPAAGDAITAKAAMRAAE